MVTYNGATYRYVHSLQGDILGLQNGTGSFVVEYRYDAWGRQVGKTGSLAATLGTLNPFRYRGYVYDEETGLYYLRSRYYNPNWCRFISSDSVLGRVGSLLQHNLWAYCCNFPIVYLDEDGDHHALSPELDGGEIAGGISGGFIPLGSHNTSSFLQALQTILWGALLGLSNPHTDVTSDDAESNEEKEKTHIHHIVARNSMYALPARRIYTMYFDINDPINLIAVPASTHSHIHTYLYYANVNMQITQAYLLGRTCGKEEEYIEKCMLGLRVQISTGTIRF